MPPIRRTGSLGIRVLYAVFVAFAAAGCAASVRRSARPAAADFFPLTPGSYREYLVTRRADGTSMRFTTVVRSTEFRGPNGLPCRIVDERYGERPADAPTPIVYCTDGGYLHRVMSLEYRGESLEDNGTRSAELRFLPINLAATPAWESRTNAYRLADGSGFEVLQVHQVSQQPDPVEVRAGRFDRCARVETTAIHSATSSNGATSGSRLVYYYSDWYAPGVGLIRSEQRSAAAEVLVTVELQDFRIDQDASGR